MTRRVTRGFRPDLLASIRVKNGLEIVDLARLAQVPAQTIRDWENGKTTPQIDTLVKIASVLKRPISSLVSVPKTQRKLSDLRILAGLTQPQLAKTLGISTSSYGELERAMRPIPEHLLGPLSSTLGVSPGEAQKAWLNAKNRAPGTPA
ncbi:transcriptional regulator, XRE family [Segniliparus rotundus DSM 44985]|uniref:Transcriptional regulator, XRE family n=1 Tax=Segniliparus rotundus (strain ATCC BAA-972 / CDC 1076 / CIP 108378 / DSM 44985 / JCM 13578) TaxID=640132 RepID=D6ZEX7_SEGRD|nr:helix-turn-helix transcriptional regulator [Segniliparus rotundus]ADG97501.1 transcriptional regulator, XRE family [Segniliparus rotundus DSM 44985]